VGALAQHCVGKEQRAGGLAMSRPKRKSRLPPFVPLLKRTSNSEAWRAMSYGARLGDVPAAVELGREALPTLSR
jgi:hypothetical protein